MTSSGGQGSEAGGAGVTYLEAGDYRNLRVDNKCNLPEITMPSSHTATADDYATMLETGTQPCWKQVTSDVCTHSL